MKMGKRVVLDKNIVVVFVLNTMTKYDLKKIQARIQDRPLVKYKEGDII